MTTHEVLVWVAGSGLFGIGLWKTVRHWITHQTIRLLDSRGRPADAVATMIEAADGRDDVDRRSARSPRVPRPGRGRRYPPPDPAPTLPPRTPAA